MKLNLLYEFQVLSKCLNYSKAAEKLYLTQPVLSRHISELESEIGAQLLVRNTRKVELTEVGRVFAEGSRQIVLKYEEMLDRIHSATNGVIGRLSIGFLNFAVSDFLSEFIIYFSNLYPQINLEYHAAEINELNQQLNQNIIDIAFSTNVLSEGLKDIKTKFVKKDHLCALFPANNILSQKNELHIEDLVSEKLITFSKENNPWTYTYLEQIFANHKLEFKPSIEAVNVGTAVFYVSTGRGILIIPEHLTSNKNQNLVQKRIMDNDCVIDILIASKTDNTNPIIDLLYDAFEKYYNLGFPNQQILL